MLIKFYGNMKKMPMRQVWYMLYFSQKRVVNMIKSFVFENFKSFEKAELNLEDVTSLIGSNSSGKSNAVEGIQILSESATGVDLSVVLDGTRNNGSHIRGGSSACCRFRTSSFKLGCLIDWDETYDLFYYIRISTSKRIWIEEEGLYKVMNGRTVLSGGEKIFKTKIVSKDSSDIKVDYSNKTAGNNSDMICTRISSVLAQLKSKLPQNTDHDKKCMEYINLALDNLKGVFILNPVPQDMRDYMRITDVELKGNGENISPVLYQLCKDEKKKKALLDVICNLPENEILGIEFIKTKLDDVIFGLRERYMNASEVVDAKKLSDGTLRCITIISAALSLPEKSILIVEEIDNGIHPGRVGALTCSLAEIGKSREIDIVLTTHNPTLLNQYDKEKLLGVSVVYRDKDKGISRFIPFVDIEQYPKLLAKGGLGEALVSDSLIDMINTPQTISDYAWLGV